MMFRFILIIIILFLFSANLRAQAYIVPDLQRDDFQTKKTWWKWQHHGGQTEATVNNGYFNVQLINPLAGASGGPLQSNGNGMENVGIMTAEQRPIYDKRDSMEVTIRLKTLNDLPVGSRGWGFWKSEGVPITTNQATWFIQQTPHPDSSWALQETWWRARTHKKVDNTYDFYVDVSSYNNQQWHTYKILRYSNSVADGFYELYIDGIRVQRIVPNDFPDNAIINEDYSFNCWNDNLVYQFIEGGLNPDSIAVTYNGWIDTSSFVVDFVEIIKNGYDPSYSVLPADNADAIRLREFESEIDDGISDGLWKTYNFTLPASNCVIVATAKAEELDTYDNDDDLKLEVDSHDYGYNSAKSWNGDVDAGLPKTIVIDTSMSTGAHSIKMYSRVTPILYDVNVFSATDGVIALDTVINDSAPAGSNNLQWKTLNFTCDNGPVLIYLSGSADEEPGWNHINSTIDSTDDDELRIMIDNTDYGWATANALEGNGLFGDVKTILLETTLTTGQHTIKLFTRESPTVYRVLAYSKNGDSGLPVQLTNFNAFIKDEQVTLNWVTESETENLGFNIFRSASADSLMPELSQFRKLNPTLIGGHGNSSVRHQYTFNDQELPASEYLWYYLQDVGYNGAVTNHQTIMVSTVEAGLPLDFQLYQNHPNPFNPNTIINYELPITANVLLTVYNSIGQKVRTPVNRKQEAGKHLVTFNAAGLASGVYYYRLQVDSYSQIRKMLLLR